jgi:hypothetical protein
MRNQQMYDEILTKGKEWLSNEGCMLILEVGLMRFPHGLSLTISQMPYRSISLMVQSMRIYSGYVPHTFEGLKS